MEQPIFTAKAHVFHIDQQTKRSWVPASQYAVNVSFYYDSSRNSYRIISVEDTKAIINSTITPNMTITKTSQKFVQFGGWTDIIYGLGFNSEAELNRFIEKFQELKEATKTAQQKVQQNGGVHTSTSSAQPQSHIIAPPSASAITTGSNPNDKNEFATREMLMSSTIKHSLNLHQRSQSLSGLQLSKSYTDSPKHATGTKMGSQLFLPQTSAEAQLKHENDRLKIALAQSSSNAKKWEIELQTLKNNNTRLTNALQESTANVEEWKKQLSALKEENSKMRSKILELEAMSGSSDALNEIKKELQNLRLTNEKLENLNEERNKEIKLLKLKLEGCNNGDLKDVEVTDKNKSGLVEVNVDLADCVNNLSKIHQKLNNILS